MTLYITLHGPKKPNYLVKYIKNENLFYDANLFFERL